MIENTSNRDPLMHVVGSLGSRGSDGYIEEMELAGQSQFVNSTQLPTRINHGSEDEITALGIVLGEPDPSDPLFRPAELPAGWSKRGSDHAMWSKVYDEHGRPRVSIFYKAAWYDRDAFMSAETIYSYAGALLNGAPLVLDEWANATDLIAALGQHRDQYAEYAERRDEDGYWAGQIEACDRVIERISELVAP